MKNENLCPVGILFGQLSKQWTLHILYTLNLGETRFSGIKKSLSGISSRTLSLRLSDLQNMGLVCRTIVNQQPIKIEYSLTDKGLSLSKELSRLESWAKNNI